MARERNREMSFVNKLSAGLRRISPNTIHVYEDLVKEDLIGRRKAKKARGKRNTKILLRNLPSA